MAEIFIKRKTLYFRELSEKKDGGHAVLDNEELNSLLGKNLD